MQSLKRLWHAIGNRVGGKPLQDNGVAKAASMRRLLKHCPVCGDGFLGHSYALFATTVLGEEEKNQTLKFFNALEEKRWRDSLVFQNWEGLRDNAEAYALRCPRRSIAMLIVHSPFELFYNDVLLACDVLDIRSGEELLTLIEENRWNRLGGE